MIRVPILYREVTPRPSVLIYNKFSSEEKDLYDRFHKESKENLEKLHTLEFFVYLRDGTRISVKELESTLQTNPSAFMQIFKRLVTVVEAVFPGSSSYYWRQAFYLSTGRSSDMPGTWLPFDGVCTQGETIGLLFYKKPFAGEDRSYNRFGINTETNKQIIFKRFYEYIYLPESFGPLGVNLPLFERFGTYSFLLASHSLGGNAFKDGYSIYKPTDSGISIDTIEKILSTPAPLPEVIQIKKDDTDVLTINEFLDNLKACSWHQAFRSFRAPGFRELSSTLPYLSYRLPHESILNQFIDIVNSLYYKYKVDGVGLNIIEGELFTNLEKLHRDINLSGGAGGIRRKNKKTRKAKKNSKKTKLRKLQTRG